MRVLCSAVLGIEAIVVFLATALATSNGSVQNTALAWVVGLVLSTLLIVATGFVGTRHGLLAGWILQLLVLSTSLVVGWSMLIVGVVFVVLWYLAVHNGRRVDALRAANSK